MFLFIRFLLFFMWMWVIMTKSPVILINGTEKQLQLSENSPWRMYALGGQELTYNPVIQRGIIAKSTDIWIINFPFLQMQSTVMGNNTFAAKILR